MWYSTHVWPLQAASSSLHLALQIFASSYTVALFSHVLEHSVACNLSLSRYLSISRNQCQCDAAQVERSNSYVTAAQGQISISKTRLTPNNVLVLNKHAVA